MTITREPKGPPVNEFGQKVMAHTRYAICSACGEGFIFGTDTTACPHCGVLVKGRARAGVEISRPELIPGATTITDLLAKPGLYHWHNVQGLQGVETGAYTDEAADTGTLAHYLIQAQILGLEPDLSDFTGNQAERAKFALNEFILWRKGKAIETVLLEEPLISKRFRFGGTVDWLVRLEGELTLIDWKTASAIYLEHYLQAAAYTYLLLENGHRVRGTRVIQVPRIPEEPLVEHRMTGAQVAGCFRLFRDLLSAYYHRRDLTRELEGRRN